MDQFSDIEKIKKSIKNIEIRINSKKITHTYLEKIRSKFLPDAISYINKYYKRNKYSLNKIQTYSLPEIISICGDLQLIISKTSNRNYMNIFGDNVYFNFIKELSLGNFSDNDFSWMTADISTNEISAIAQIKPISKLEEDNFTENELIELKNKMAQHIMNMDDLTADVMDVLASHWIKKASTDESMTNITADDILEARGIEFKKSGMKKANGEVYVYGYTKEQRDEIARHMSILDNTWIRVLEKKKRKKGNKENIQWYGECRAIVLTANVGFIDEAGANPYAWRARPGDVFAKFWFGPGRGLLKQCSKALTYDPYRHKYEKRLTRCLSWHFFTVRETVLNEHIFTINSLLEFCKMSIEFERPSRTKERLEKALNTLQADNIIKNWSYLKSNFDHLNEKKWFDEWLKSEVIILPPLNIEALYSNSEFLLKESSDDAIVPTIDNGYSEIIKTIRLKKNITLRELADTLQISYSSLSRIENNERTVSKKNKPVLDEWISKNNHLRY